jgi:adenosine kinase
MSSILVSGSLAYDRIMAFPGKFREHIHEDKMHVLSVSFVVSTLQESFGGTAGNIAYTFSLLGQHPSVISTAGGDFGKYYDRLQQLGIHTQAIQRADDVPTATGHIITDAENNQITAFYIGAMGRPYVREVPEADLAIIAAGNGVDMIELSRKYRLNSTPFFFDPGQMLTVLSGEELREAIPGASVVFGNDYEIGMLLRKTGWNIQELLDKVSTVVTTLGSEGTLITTNEKEYRVRSVPAVQVLDPTGAGDAYRAGFATAWLQKLPIDVCAKVASAVAVYAVECYGTQNHVFTLSQLAERYKQAYGEEFPLIAAR